MLRMVCMVVACVALVAVAAGAEAVMGIYEGEFTSGAWKGNGVEVQVVTLGKGSYKAVFPFDAVTPRVEIRGSSVDGVVRFQGPVNLGAAKGGKCDVKAKLRDGAIEGEFKGEGKACKFKAAKVDRQSPTVGVKCPEGGIVLFDGTDLDAWQRWPLKWNLIADAGAMEVCGSNLVTTQEFGDCVMHIEFRTPVMPEARGQGRGNSGVYVQGRYEIQVLDSFGEEPADNLCGGIYKVAVPKADACLPPGVWQTYDVTFTAARFDANGKKTQNAVITVLHNGVPIHENLVLPDVTPGGISGVEAATGPILLQDHGNSVRYRNIWVAPK